MTALLLLATIAHGQAGSGSNPAPSSRSGNVAASTSAQADVQADAAFQDRLESVRTKGAQMPGETRAQMEAKLEASAQRTDAAAMKNESEVTTRLAKEFRTSASVLAEEKARLQTGYGQLVIAHTFAANTKPSITVDQLYAMRANGMGWGQIAAGLGLNLDGVENATQAETRVALGERHADGRVAIIHGEGAKAGLGTSAGLDATRGNAGAGAHATVGLGVHLQH
jgi:hypothetical protein